MTDLATNYDVFYDNSTPDFSAISTQLPRSLFETKLDNVLAYLQQEFCMASRENWDGCGAAAAKRSSYEFAKSFLNLLPPKIKVPNVGIDSDGDIGLEWIVGKNIFVVSFSGNNMISYGGVIDCADYCDETTFFEEIPDDLNSILDEFFPID